METKSNIDGINFLVNSALAQVPGKQSSIHLLINARKKLMDIKLLKFLKCFYWLLVIGFSVHIVYIYC